MVKLRWLKQWKERKPGEISNVAKKSAENFVSQGYAEYIYNKNRSKKQPKKIETKKLTESEVYEKIKEISNIEEPLKIEQELKELAKSSDFSIQALKKQLNYLLKKHKKDVIKISDKDDINDIDDIVDKDDIDKEKKACISFISLYHELFPVLFNNTLLEQIMKHILVAKRPLLVGELALKTGKATSHIHNTISKNKQYFSVYKTNGKNSDINVTNKCLQELTERAEQIKQIQEQKRKSELELKEKELRKIEFIQEIQNYLAQTKIKREGYFLIIDFKEILNYSSKLADFLLESPEKIIEQVQNKYSNKLSIKFTNIPDIHNLNIEDLRKENLDKLIKIEGRVTSLGEVKPVITKTIHACPSCGTFINIEQNYREDSIREPERCSCGRKGGFILEEREESNACFIQLEDLQDRTDNPQSRRIKSVLFNHLCEPEIIKKFAPGNEIKCSGILKEVPIYKRGKRSLFLNWVFEILDAELIEKDVNVDEFDEETIDDIKELAQNIHEEGLDYLNESFAPEVWGYDEIKQAIMLQLANRRNEAKIKATRNKSNILLIGDPGIAKTVLGKFAVKVSSGAKEAVGGGSSAVGITASVIKEEESMGGYRVEPGAMILAKDLLFIDELNNLNDEDKPKLQEGMSEQSVSINKANLHVKMKVTCGILAVANPLHGHFKEDSKESLQEQFNIPSPILNRFDTVFMIRDLVNDDSDKKIAERMMKRHLGEMNNKYSSDFLRKYFSYVRHFPEPIIPEEISKTMKEVYSFARKRNSSGVKINPRFFESLIRMSSAMAKMRLSEEVNLDDIKTTLRILAKSQYQIEELMLENHID